MACLVTIRGAAGLVHEDWPTGQWRKWDDGSLSILEHLSGEGDDELLTPLALYASGQWVCVKLQRDPSEPETD